MDLSFLIDYLPHLVLVAIGYYGYRLMRIELAVADQYCWVMENLTELNKRFNGAGLFIVKTKELNPAQDLVVEAHFNVSGRTPRLGLSHSPTGEKGWFAPPQVTKEYFEAVLHGMSPHNAMWLIQKKGYVIEDVEVLV